MKTPLKYLTIAGLTIAALTWPLWKLNATEVEGERETREDIGAREAFRRLQLQDENGQIPPDAWTNAYAEKDAMPFLPEAWSEFSTAEQIEAGIGGGVWSSIGPGNIGGRIRSIIIHPGSTTDANTTMWAGSASGGIWKTTNGGESWTTNTDFLANLAVTCLVIDPTNPDILYAGTGGDIGYYALQGNGIFKTIDGGDHWEHLLFTRYNPNFHFVNRLAISPTNPQLLLAATTRGIFRTTDGGAQWSPATGLPADTWADVRFRPPSVPGEVEIPDVPGISSLAASVVGRVYYSTDQGASWTPANGFPSPAGDQRIELGYSRSQPWIVYASKAHPNHNLSELFRSVNGGYSFYSLGHPLNPFDNLPGAFWYANVLWVDPINPDTVIVGGIFHLRTMDRGITWEESDAFSHLDTHVLVEHPQYGEGTVTPNATVYSGNDGGVHRTHNILAVTATPAPGGSVRWTSRNNSLGVTQFYGAAGHAASGTIIGGTQDNGTVRYRPQFGPEHWDFMAHGDGGRCAVDQTASPYFYGELPALQIYRNTHGGGSTGHKSEYIWGGPGHPNGISNPVRCGEIPCANFIAPFVIDPNLDQQNEQKTLLAGSEGLWRTINARTDEAVDVCWAEIKSPYPAGCVNNCDKINAIAIAEGNSNLVWIGYNTSSVFYTTNGTVGAVCPSPSSTPTWISGDPNNVLPRNRLLTSITIGRVNPAEVPEPPRTVYATFGSFFPTMTDTRGNVWKREGNGAWTPIHNDLPSTPVFSLVVSPSNPAFLYVATEVGVFASSNGGQNWSPAFGGSSADTLVYSLVVSASAPSSPDIIYVGTEDGVFASKDGGDHWSPGFGGPANTRAEQLFWMVTPQTRQLVIATHGRGMFTLGPAND